MTEEHKDMELLICAYADGELSDEEFERAEAYFTEHPEAKARMESYREMDRALAKEGVPETGALRVSEEEWRSAWDHVRRRTTGGGSRPGELTLLRGTQAPPRRAVYWWLPAAAAILVVCLAFALRGGGGNVQTPVHGPVEPGDDRAPIVLNPSPDTEFIADPESGSGLLLPKEDLLPSARRLPSGAGGLADEGKG